MKMYNIYSAINGKPDIIHAKCTMWGAILARAISKRKEIPYIVTTGASIFARGIAGPRECGTATEALRAADRLLSVSGTLAEDLDRILKVPSSSFTTVPNMIDVEKFPYSPLPDNDQFVFGYMANLVADKGHDTLLRAFTRVPGCKLFLAGGGPLRAELELSARVLGVDDRVTFLGEIPRAEAHTFFQDIDAFVHPSRYETFGIVLVEALATGRPVVATRCGGPNEIVRDGDGILVDVDDVDGLATAMIEIMEIELDREAMRSGVEDRYSKKAVRNKLLEIYNSTL